MFEIMADLKVGGGGVTKEVSHSDNVWQNLNEIFQFTPELWFYDAFWPASTNILKLGDNARS